MADEQTPKKVVKRVVKKPIAGSKPAKKVVSSAPAPPVMRYGRPTADPTTKMTATTVAPQLKASPTKTPPVKTPPVKIRPAKTTPTVMKPKVSAPKVNLSAALTSIRTRTSSTASAIGSGTGRAWWASADFTAGRWAALRAWHLPRFEPVRATLITGLLVGLMSVGLAVGALRLFTEVRGVANGGPLWGSLTFVMVTIVALVLGERLLAGFGTPMARLTSFLGVVLTLITILSVFLGLADSRYGLVIVPAVTAAAFWGAHQLLSLAESSPIDAD